MANGLVARRRRTGRIECDDSQESKFKREYYTYVEYGHLGRQLSICYKSFDIETSDHNASLSGQLNLLQFLSAYLTSKHRSEIPQRISALAELPCKLHSA